MSATLADTAYPHLLRHARCELRRLGLATDQAEDLVQEASWRWLERVALVNSPVAWLKTCISGLAVNLVRSRDPLDMEPLSVDELQL